jgi:hypothetical protein
MHIGRHANHQLFPSDFNETRNYLNIFSKNIQISIFMKVPPMAAELFHTDGQMEAEMTS